jgi:hypothetical protein
MRSTQSGRPPLMDQDGSRTLHGAQDNGVCTSWGDDCCKGDRLAVLSGTADVSRSPDPGMVLGCASGASQGIELEVLR